MNTNPSAKTILCYGDSNTWGQRPDKGRYPANVRWTGLLQQALGIDYYVIEEGLSSRTTDLDYERKPGRNGKTYLAPCLDSHRPLDLVILMLGTNDFKIEFNRSAKDIAEAVRGLVKIIQDKVDAKILLVSPILVDNTKPLFQQLYPDYYNHESVMKSKQLAQELEVVARETGCTFADASKVAAPGDDGIHFSAEAHAGLGKLLAQKTKEVLGA